MGASLLFFLSLRSSASNTLTFHRMLWLDQTLTSFSGHLVNLLFNNQDTCDLLRVMPANLRDRPLREGGLEGDRCVNRSRFWCSRGSGREGPVRAKEAENSMGRVWKAGENHREGGS